MFAKKICCISFLILFFVAGLAAQDLKLEEVFAKHLASIGNEEKRKQLNNMMLLGYSEFQSKLPQRKSSGKVAIVSDSTNLLFISSFLSENYPYEKIGIFGGKINVPFVSSGIRSPLGDFLWEHPSLLESGLFAGSMSLKWSLLDENFKKSKNQLVGTKKIDGKKMYVVEHYPRGSSEEFKIRLFFDAETFQHVRSEYREEFTGKAPAFPGSRPGISETFGRVNGYLIQLTEIFGEFQTYEGITLPSLSKVQYMGSSSKGTFEYDWIFRVNEVKFNQTLKENFFTF